MSTKRQKPPVAVVLLCVIIVLLVIAVAMLAVLLLRQDVQKPEQTQSTAQTVDQQVQTDPKPEQTDPQQEQTAAQEETNVPLITDYIVLSYPAELEEFVTVEQLTIDDGQKIVFTTDFTGETLELFHFTISRSGAPEEYTLGMLQDESGDLTVCVYVPDYSNGSRTPEQYNQLIALQGQVNDMIVQFYEDPRFVPDR